MNNHSIYSLSVTTVLFLTSFIVDVRAGRVGPTTGTVGPLSPGDIIYADSGDAITGGLLVKVNPVTGEQIILSAGGLLSEPFIPILDQSGAIVVSDTNGRIVRVDAAT